MGRRQLLGTLALLALAAPGCQSAARSEAQTAEAAAEAPQPALKVVRVQLQPWPRGARVQGGLLADEHAVVGAKVAGRVKLVHVDLGSAVQQGQQLIGLETEELELKVRQAEAQLKQSRAKLGLKPAQKEETLDRTRVPTVVQEEALWKEAKANLERFKALYAGKVVSIEDLQRRQAVTEVAEARYHAALNDVDDQIALVGVRRAELALAEQNLTDAVVRAPFQGIVQERHVAPGSYVQVGQAVVTLAKTDPLRFRCGVPEREALQVRLRQKVELRVAGDSGLLQGSVTRISPALDASNRSLVIEADLPNPDARLRAGLFAEGEIIVGPDARTLAVPAAAVTEFAGVEKVWLVRGGEAKQQVVQTGRRNDKWIEILRGLAPGDVIAADARQARAGKVTVAAEESGAGGTPAPQAPRGRGG